MTRLQRFLSLSWLSIGDKAFPVMGENDIVPGHEKPTMILARMLAAEMLQNIDVPVSKRHAGTYAESVTCSFPSFDVVFYLREDPHSPGRPVTKSVYSVTLKGGLSASFKTAENNILMKAFDSFSSLRKAKEAADKEAARQQAAIDAIAKICKIPEKEDQ